MRRGDRLFEIIEILRRARSPISAETIGAELEVTKRTVYRDISALMAQRVPIRGEAGVGYVLEQGYHMPPLMLTSDEIEAAVLGAQWVQTRGEPDLVTAATSLIAKIAAVTPDTSQHFFVEPNTSVAPVAPSAEVFSASEIRCAIRERLKIALTYADGTGATTDRVIWPILVGYRDAGRIIAAWCELRQAFRYFRSDRIATAKVLTERIPRRMDILRREWRAAMDVERARFNTLSGKKESE
ncbi:DNA-binding protein [Tateyamaria omphalii]|uniref:helix-turn-helix transcriptional regulator n=1 Tax=Tateyamaria omphalii TaxID=299262 RepID=UPI001671C99A|nr:YafY family protein [Tateyamaria omphalii]GGX41245.1 DNA-binding protein [Tateyamaria omphalii]